MWRLLKHPFGCRQHRMVRLKADKYINYALRKGTKDKRSSCHCQIFKQGFLVRQSLIIEIKGEQRVIGEQRIETMIMYTVFYIINFYNNHIMQILETPQTMRPKRSLSYNDLKKKRLIRSSKSTKKLNNGESYFSTVKKRPASQVKSIISNVPKDEKVIQSYILQLKGMLGQMRLKSEKKRNLYIRQNNLTERQSIGNSLQNNENRDKPIWNKIVDPSNTKQMIKNLLVKNKNSNRSGNTSQRRLVKFSQIRDNFKKEKSMSRSNDKIEIKEIKIKEIPSPLKNQTKYKNSKESTNDIQYKIEANNSNKDTKKYFKLSQVQTLTDYKIEQSPSQIKLDNNPPKQINIEGKQNHNKNQNPSLVINDVSAIINVQQKHTKDNQSTFNILECLKTKEMTHIQGSFLKLMNQYEFNNFFKQGKDTKRRFEMERIKRIFPKGFFDN